MGQSPYRPGTRPGSPAAGPADTSGLALQEQDSVPQADLLQQRP